MASGRAPWGRFDFPRLLCTSLLHDSYDHDTCFLFGAAYIPPGPPVTYTFASATDAGDDSQRDDGVLPGRRLAR